jgi:indole-3-glycerol phosphate synthase
MNILEEIIAKKKKEIEPYKLRSPIERFEREGFFWQIRTRSLLENLLMPGSNGVIAEFKRKSPSKGWFKNKEMEVEPVVSIYNKAAAGVSILTNEFFGGDLDDLIQSKVITDIPVLRKDFIIDRWQIAESKAFGADVVLLIAACLTKTEVKEFAGYAYSVGLESILEIHREEELDHYCDEITMIGINNRDLDNFDVKLETSFQLIKKISKDKVVISESGIDRIESIVTLRNAGFKGFLIGEQFMKHKDPANTFNVFMDDLRKKII